MVCSLSCTLNVRFPLTFLISARPKGYADAFSRLGPFLSLLKPEKLSLIVILEVMRLQSSGGISGGMKTTRALLSVGMAVEHEYKAEMCKKNKIQMPTVGTRETSGFFSKFSYNDLHARRVTARRYMEDGEEWTSQWTQPVRIKVGSFLVDRLMECAMVERTAPDPKNPGNILREEQPAFFHSYEYIRGNKLGVLKLNQVVQEKLGRDGVRETLHPRHLPMLVKPKPWLNYNDGGYIYNKCSYPLLSNHTAEFVLMTVLSFVQPSSCGSRSLRNRRRISSTPQGWATSNSSTQVSTYSDLRLGKSTEVSSMSFSKFGTLARGCARSLQRPLKSQNRRGQRTWRSTRTGERSILRVSVLGRKPRRITTRIDAVSTIRLRLLVL